LKHYRLDDEDGDFTGQSDSETSFVVENEQDGPFEKGYVTNQDGVASDMITFLHKFYKNFPEKREAELILASESYGGTLFAV
jgi:Serine carboxypeptidase